MILWIYTPPSDSDKWRFSWGFPGLKIYHDPTSKWHPGWGVDPNHTSWATLEIIRMRMIMIPASKRLQTVHGWSFFLRAWHSRHVPFLCWALRLIAWQRWYDMVEGRTAGSHISLKVPPRSQPHGSSSRLRCPASKWLGGKYLCQPTPPNVPPPWEIKV